MTRESRRNQLRDVLLITVLILCTCNLTVRSYSIETQPEDLWINSGYPATLQCKFDVSATSCSWRFNKGGIDLQSYYPDYQLESSKTGICNLHISNVSLEQDEGLWTCVLPRSPTGEGLLSRDAYLTVLVLPTPPIVYYEGELQQQSTLIAPAGSVARLQCLTQHGHPPTNLSWAMDELWENKTTITSKEEASDKLFTTESELRLPISREDHGRNIYCIAQHGQRRLYTGMTLDVQYNTTSVKISPRGVVKASVGSTLVLQCSADGNPLPKYVWTANFANTSSWREVGSTARLELTIAPESDGVYKCVAGNELMLQSEELYIEVQKLLGAEITLIAALVCFGFVLALAAVLIWYLKYRYHTGSRTLRGEDDIRMDQTDETGRIKYGTDNDEFTEVNLD